MAVDTHPISPTPPGVTPNYVNPHTISSRIIVTSMTLMVLSSLFVVTRMMIKWRVLKKWSYDDGLIFFAMLLIIARSIICTINATNFGLGRHIWDIPPKDIVHWGPNQKNFLFIADMIYLISIMCIKIAILMLYVQIFRIKRHFRYLCFAMMFVVFSYCIIFFFIEAFNCNPVQKNWHVLSYKGKYTCFDNNMVEFVIGGFNIGTDCIILILPIPLVLELQIELKRRLALLAVFGTGFFCVISTIVREVIVVKTLSNFDSSWNTVPETIWLTVENDVGIICACLPALVSLKNTRLFGVIIPSKIQYLLDRSGYSSRKSSSKESPSKDLDLHDSDSGVELVRSGTLDRDIRRTTDVSVVYSGAVDASNKV